MTGLDIKFKKEENWIQISMHFDTPLVDLDDALKRISEYCLVQIKLNKMFKGEIKIQCPECGNILNILLDLFYCAECDKHFNETEIRERCGI